MAAEIKFEDLGLIEYAKAWKYQETCQQQVINSKNTPGSVDYNRVLFCEHPHVYTLGKSGQQENLLINPEFLQSIGATFFKIDRGGDITYHGPGQLVGYPIINLELFGIGVKTYIHNLEESIIETLKDFGIISSRLPGSTGVWLDAEKQGFSRKICAIGVKISRYVTMHGFALNVNPDLNYFTYINPCGFVDKGVTSMEKELGKKADMEEVKRRFRFHFNRFFKVKNP
ncbi:MAG: lipoyl(octanoyl) transferase LipB [Bacteroidales bacterium]|nr:lipoyl(octanoyl) transferase LipB [Bacteroidales bacterium]